MEVGERPTLCRNCKQVIRPASQETCLAFISSIMTLNPGDIILTGTPAGTAPLEAGDVVEVQIDGIGSLTNPVVKQM